MHDTGSPKEARHLRARKKNLAGNYLVERFGVETNANPLGFACCP